MPLALPFLALLSVALTVPEAQFVQVAPVVREMADAHRTPGQERAVVLIHGLLLHPIHVDAIKRAEVHAWQQPDSLMVSHLVKEGDVFAFAYAQDGPADEVSETPLLQEGVRRLRALGYQSIVLVGHSAGAIVARHFVEDHPDAGVTKVIQVCPPNGGSPWACWQIIQPKQAGFLDSLTKPVRRLALTARTDHPIPRHIEFACIVANGLVIGDGLVGIDCQWTEDLQRQGIPAYRLATTHWQAVRTKAGAALIAELVRSPQPRWDAAHVAAARHRLRGP